MLGTVISMRVAECCPADYGAESIIRLPRLARK
jgi:hypothetical protein